MKSERPKPDRAFEEPWHAAAFALAVHLHDRGVFTWPEWSEALGRSLRAAEHERGGSQGDDEATESSASGECYYTAWLAALQSLLEERGMVGMEQVDSAIDAWREAYLRTPHGEPVEMNAWGDSPH